MNKRSIAKILENEILRGQRVINTMEDIMSNLKSLNEMDDMEGMEDGGMMVDVEVGAVLGVNTDFTLETLAGDEIDVAEGCFMVMNPGETEGLFLVDIYDENSEVIETELVVAQDEIDELVSEGYMDIIPEEEITYEGTHIDEAFVKFSHGKMKKFKIKAKKGFKRVGTKYVKISAASLAKMRKNAIKAGRKAHTGKAKLMAKKTMRIRKARVQDSVNLAIGYEVKEGFDIVEGSGENKRKIALESGDCLSFVKDKDIKLEISRDGKSFVSGMIVDETFLNTCINDNLIKESGEEITKLPDEEETEEKETEEKETEEKETEEESNVEESVLTFRNEKGYIFNKNGKNVVLGNRIRARSYLISEGFNVSAGALDSAFAGKKVKL
jgi:hypothetical protein